MNSLKLFVCLEGVDCVGKTTVARAVAEQLKGTYYKSPGGDYAKARFVVDVSYSPAARYQFYRQAVQYDSEAIRELLKHSSVVCDRYIFSTFAVHAALDPALQRGFESTNMLMPDYVFLLVSDELVRQRRLSSRAVHVGLDDDFALQRRADEFFRRQGHQIIDTSLTTVAQAAARIMQALQLRVEL